MKVKEMIEELEKYDQDAQVILWNWTNKNGSRFNELMFGASQNYPKAVLVVGNMFCQYSQDEIIELFGKEKK